MSRPRKPHWVIPGPGRRGVWRTQIDGQYHYLRGVGRYDKPLVGSGVDAIPLAAWDWLHGLEAEARRPSTAEPSCHWLCNWYLQWARSEVQAGRLSEAQWMGQRSRLGLLLAWPGVRDTPAGRLGVETVAAFLGDLRGRYSPSYVAGVGRTVRTVWRWAARPVPGRSPLRLIAANPLDGYRFPRAPVAPRGYVPGEVVRGFYRWAWARARAQPGVYRRFDRLFVLCLWFQRLTGCRPGEAVTLRWDSWDRDAGKITLTEHKSAHLGKSRVIWVTPPVARLLRVIDRLPDRHPDYVFTHRRARGAIDRGEFVKLAGEPWPSGSAASAKVRALRELALPRPCEGCEGARCKACRGRGVVGVPGLEGEGPRKLVAYCNRHGYASDAISAGWTTEHVADLLGNTAQVTAATYTHSIDSATRARAVAIASGRGSKTKPAGGG